MAGCGHTDDVLKKCIADVLSAIKPVDKDVNLRKEAIKELEDSISSVKTLTGAVIRTFGSYLSDLYTVSGDLDVSVELPNNLKMAKQIVLKNILDDLKSKDIPRDAKIIPAKVPILQYVSSKVGISCDISVNNYPGVIKSKVLYWINTLDKRFGDMVLLVKEWAKSQGINDPKNGTLNSYSLCLLVVFHFQTCTPPILPPLKEIYDLNVKDAAVYCEKDLDNVCEENIAKFQSQNTKSNQSSLSELFATFFRKFSFIDRAAVISTFEGQITQTEKNPYPQAKYISPLLVDDPFERPVNAARTVKEDTIDLITSAFSRAKSAFVLDGRTADRNELLSLMCTAEVGKKLGVTAVPHPDTSPAMNQRLRSLLQQELVEEKDHLHPSEDMAHILRFLHIPGEVAEDDV